MNSCRSCNTENVFHLFRDEDQYITAKLVKSPYNKPFVELMVHDGNQEFLSAGLWSEQFDQLIRELLAMRKYVKEWCKDTDV